MGRLRDWIEIDAETQTIRCLVCQEEIPIPLGCMDWVNGVVRAYKRAHPRHDHAAQRTWFATRRPERRDRSAP